MRRQLEQTETKAENQFPLPTTTTGQDTKTVAAAQITQAIKTKTYSINDVNTATVCAVLLGIVSGFVLASAYVPLTVLPAAFWANFPWTFLAAILTVSGVISAALITRNTSERKRLSDEKTANDKLDLDKLNAAKKEQQDQFVDIQNRFAAKEDIMRANAALRLGEFAVQPLPRTTTEEHSPPDLPITRENYPYFLRAASQLATALHMEMNDAVRKNIVEALSGMVRWDSLPDDNILLTELINRIVNANRTAKDNFIEAFAAWSVVSEEWKRMESDELNLAGTQQERDDLLGNADPEELHNAPILAFALPLFLTSFCDLPEVTTMCLQSLRAEIRSGSGVTKFAVAKTVHENRRKLMNNDEERNKDTALRLPMLETTANTLIDARDALAVALTKLAEPKSIAPLPLDSAKLHEFFWKNVPYGERNWRREPEINLSGCFLAGANLVSANLQAVSFVRAHLQGASIGNANLQGTCFNQAHLQGAKLTKAKLRSVTLNSANLSRADLSYSELQKTNLENAKFEKTNVAYSTIDQAHSLPPDWEDTFDFRLNDIQIDNDLKERIRTVIARQHGMT